MRGLIFLLSLIGVLYCFTFSNSRRSKPKRVCRRVRKWESVPRSTKAIAKRKVLTHFPFASVRYFQIPSKKHILIDRRNEAVFEKGYFVVGYDNGQTRPRFLSEYDFYVTYSNDTNGSHFFLKALTIRKAIEGCQKQVKFVYKDHDATIKPIMSSIGFHDYKIGYQTEFHNSSANAGVITGRSSKRTKYIVSLWDGAAGLGENLEKDQTTLRALVKEDENSFFQLPPNSVARHVYSSSRYRSSTIQKTRIIYSTGTFYLYRLFLLGISLHFCRRIVLYRSRRAFKPIQYLKRKLAINRTAPNILVLVMVVIIDEVISSPMLLAKLLGIPTILNLGMYHPAIQLQADDLARVWKDKTGFHMGTIRETFLIPSFKFFSPLIFSQIYDTAFILKCMLPMKVLAFYFVLISLLDEAFSKNPK